MGSIQLMRLIPTGVISCDGYRLKFKASWVKGLKEIPPVSLNGSEKSDENEDRSDKNLPTQVLRAVLYFIFPQILSIEKFLDVRAGQGQDVSWIFAREEIDTEIIAQVIRTWVRVMWNNSLATEFARNEIQGDKLEWEPVHVEIPSPCPTTANNTAKLDSNVFTFMAAYLAEEFLREIGTIALAQPVEFFRVTIPDNPNTVRLISRSIRSGKKMWSYQIDLSFQTVPFNPVPFFQIKGGKKNWANAMDPGDRIKNLSWKQSHTVYLLSNRLYGSSKEEAGNNIKFHMTSSKVKITRSNDETGPHLVWEEKINEILEQMGFDMPTIDQISAIEQGTTQVGNTGFEVLLSRGTADNQAWDLLTGFENKYRRVVYKTLGEFFKQKGFMQPEERGEALKIRPAPSGFLEKNKMDSEEIHAALFNSRPEDADEVVLEIFARNTEVFAFIAAKFGEVIKMPPTFLDEKVAEFEIGNSSQPFKFLLQFLPSAKIAKLLPPSSSPGKVGKARKNYVQRAQEISSTYPKPTRPTATLVELKDLRSETAITRSYQDPKEAIRYGFAQSGRLSQFLAPLVLTEDLVGDSEIRCKRAVLDALRQLGFNFVVPLPPPGQDIICDYFGLWFVRQNDSRWDPARGRTQFPVLICIEGESGKVFATYCDDEETPHRYPYYLFLLKLAESRKAVLLCNQFLPGKTRKPLPNEIKLAQQLATQHLLGEIKPCSEGHQPILFVDAQNIRGVWAWVQNTQLSSTTVGLILPVSSPYSRNSSKNITEKESLQDLVVIRSRKGGEEPQQYGVNVNRNSPLDSEENYFSFAQGLLLGPRYSVTGCISGEASPVFYDICRRPTTLRGLKPNYEHTPGTRRPKPWKSQLAVEVTVIPQGECSQEELIALAALHPYARVMSITFNDYLSKPYPLHLAAKAREYTFPKLNDE